MTKFKIILISAIAIAGSTTSLVIQHQAQVRLGANEAVLRQQVDQLAALQLEQKRLSNRLAQANSSPAGDQTAEMMKLRSQAQALRKQTNGATRVDVTGAPGRYVLQASANATVWQPMTTNVSATGNFSVYETMATDRPVWLYRAEQ